MVMVYGRLLQIITVSRKYLIKVSGDEGDGITCCCHLDEATEDSVPHWSVLIHAVKQVTQPVTPQHKRDDYKQRHLYIFLKLRLI